MHQQAGQRRQRAALAAALAVGFCVGVVIDPDSAPLALCAAVLGGVAYRLSR